MIKIATWNVNSVRARLPNLIDWLGESRTDIVLLQEIKCVTEAFPYMEIEDLGYNIAVNGQKTYNGVAILSRFPIDDITNELPRDDNDNDARYIEGVISADGEVLRVASVYVPNGSSPDSEKFIYKMNFFRRLKEHINTLLDYEEKLIIGGDLNVAPEDIDVYDPEKLRGSIGFHPDEQAKFRSIIHLGLTDIFRSLNPGKQQFSWWDYRSGGWRNGRGMRLDHLLLSPQAADIARACAVDDYTRGESKASDHAPVWCELG